jgi:hypothetical protein
MPGRSRPLPTRISLYESLILDPPPSICCRRRRNTSFSCPYNYDVVFCMIFPCRSDLEPFTVWYKIKVCSESRVKNLENEIIEIQRPVWAGVVPIFASVAALGCDIYFIGGEYVPLSLSRRRAVSLSDVYKVDVTTDREGLLHTVPSMQYIFKNPSSHFLT